MTAPTTPAHTCSNGDEKRERLDRIAARVAELEVELADRDHPRHTVGTLSWVKEEMRLRGHVCTDIPKPETCPACVSEKEERDANSRRV